MNELSNSSIESLEREIRVLGTAENPVQARPPAPFFEDPRSNEIESPFYNKILTDPAHYDLKRIPEPPTSQRTLPRTNEVCVHVRERNRFEAIEALTDKFPLVELRQAILRISAGFSQLCRLLIANALFEALIITIIIMNTVTLAMEDPLAAAQHPTLQFLDELYL